MIDLDVVRSTWLQQCGPCDAGLLDTVCTHPAGDYRPVMLELVREVERLRWSAIYRPGLDGGVCRACGGKEHAGHRMHCRHYVGPLEHRWIGSQWNGTFAGVDHQCLCGGSIRVGGMAGAVLYGEEPVCPNAAETRRGPQPTCCPDPVSHDETATR